MRVPPVLIVNITNALLSLEVGLYEGDHVGFGPLLALFVLHHPLDVPGQTDFLPLHDPLLVVQSRHPADRLVLQTPDRGGSRRGQGRLEGGQALRVRRLSPGALRDGLHHQLVVHDSLLDTDTWDSTHSTGNIFGFWRSELLGDQAEAGRI